MKNTAAFFDIDGTLYRESLMTEVFKKLIKHEIIEPQRWYADVKHDYDKWDKREGNYDNYLIRMATIYIEAIKGLHKSQIDFIANKVINQKGDRVYTYTRDRIRWHKEQKHLTITVSGSPSELVKEMADKHGFFDYMGTEYKLDKNQIYTGEVTPMWDSISKEKAIKALAEKYNIDLSKSYAYGDTMGDYSMLKMVGNPAIINATREVYNRIVDDEKLRDRIKIIVERKDLIYQLKPDDITIL